MKTLKSAVSKRSFFSIVLLGLLVLLTASACTFSGIPVAHGDNLDIQATFSEADMNTLLAHSHQHDYNKDYDLLDEITSVDMQDGLIRIYGTRQNQGETVSGSYDVSLAAENGALKVQIVAVNIPGMSLDSPRVQSTNQKIARSLSRSAAENYDHLTFNSVKVTEDKLQMNLTVRLNR